MFLFNSVYFHGSRTAERRAQANFCTANYDMSSEITKRLPLAMGTQQSGSKIEPSTRDNYAVKSSQKRVVPGSSHSL